MASGLGTSLRVSSEQMSRFCVIKFVRKETLISLFPMRLPRAGKGARLETNVQYPRLWPLGRAFRRGAYCRCHLNWQQGTPSEFGLIFALIRIGAARHRPESGSKFDEMDWRNSTG